MGPRGAGMRIGATPRAAQVLALLLPLPALRGEMCTPTFQLRRFWFRKNFCGPACGDDGVRGTSATARSYPCSSQFMEADMGFGRGALLWLIGIPLPIILLLALFMHH